MKFSEIKEMHDDIVHMWCELENMKDENRQLKAENAALREEINELAGTYEMTMEAA